MTTNITKYPVKSWMVHLMYGLGQIVEIEKKPVRGKSQECYRVKTKDVTFWVPVEDADNDRVRPVATAERINRALDILKEPAEEMDADYKERRKRIQGNTMDGVLRSDIALIRDMHARELGKGLSKPEQASLDRLKTRFIEEWSISLGQDLDSTYQKFDLLLEKNALMAVIEIEVEVEVAE